MVWVDTLGVGLNNWIPRMIKSPSEAEQGYRIDPKKKQQEVSTYLGLQADFFAHEFYDITSNNFFSFLSFYLAIH